jgi:hypothetical protein
MDGTVQVYGNSLDSANNNITSCSALQRELTVPAGSAYSSGGMLLLFPDAGLAKVHGNKWTCDGDRFSNNSGLDAAGAMHAVNVDKMDIVRSNFSQNLVLCASAGPGKDSAASCVGGGAIAYQASGGENGAGEGRVLLTNTVLVLNQAEHGGATAVYANQGTVGFGTGTVVAMEGVAKSSADGATAVRGGIVLKSMDATKAREIRCPPGQELKQVQLPGLKQLQCSKCQCDSANQYLVECNNLFSDNHSANEIKCHIARSAARVRKANGCTGNTATGLCPQTRRASCSAKQATAPTKRFTAQAPSRVATAALLAEGALLSSLLARRGQRA